MKVAVRMWSLMMRMARVVSSSWPYFVPESSSILPTMPEKISVSYTVLAPISTQ